MAKRQEVKTIQIRSIPVEVMEQLRTQAFHERRHYGEIIADALRLYFKASRKGKRK